MKKIRLLSFTVSTLFVVLFNCAKNENPVMQQDTNETEDIFENLVSKDTLKVPIVHHISRNNGGTNAAVTEDRILKVIRDLNDNFKSAKIQFYTKQVKLLDNSQWNSQFIKQDDFTDSKVLASFEDDEALNIFYFIKLLNRVNGEITEELGATALFPDQGNNLKLSASSIEPENTATVTHEIGHYLGLYHTDDNFTDSQGRIELVDGSNCTEAGDKICDTPASPDLNDSNIDEPTCNYVGTEMDPAGKPYKPDTLNFMTQWAGTDPNGFLCRRRFSKGQIEKMVSVLNKERSYLITRE